MSNTVIDTKAAFQVDETGGVTGIAWPFGSADRVGDMVEKGAFAGTTLPVPMLFSHDQADPVGTWTHVEETDEGFIVKGQLLIADVIRAREVQALVNAGALGGLSIGFSTKKATTRKGGGRTIQALDLVEISLVTVPCHPGARLRAVKAGATAIALAEAINRVEAIVASRLIKGF